MCTIYSVWKIPSGKWNGKPQIGRKYSRQKSIPTKIYLIKDYIQNINNAITQQWNDKLPN